jgi:hypothetical protein
MGQSLLHEVGHAHSTQEGLSHARPDTRQALGQEEAYADDTMMRHWRPDPRDARRGKVREVTPSYEHKEVFKGTRVPFSWSSGRGNQTGGVTAHKSYMAARTTPIMKEKRDREWQARRKDATHQPEMLGIYSGMPSEHAFPPAEHARYPEHLNQEQFGDPR